MSSGGESTAWHVHVVGGAKDEDPLSVSNYYKHDCGSFYAHQNSHVGRIDLLICITSTCSAVRVTCMSGVNAVSRYIIFRGENGFNRIYKDTVQ